MVKLMGDGEVDDGVMLVTKSIKKSIKMLMKKLMKKLMM